MSEFKEGDKVIFVSKPQIYKHVDFHIGDIGTVEEVWIGEPKYRICLANGEAYTFYSSELEEADDNLT